MDKWDELRTAYHVAKLGTATGAADALGVHRATVIRHIDALEAAFGAKLFQRHQKGYTPTDAGADLLRVAAAVDEQFQDLAKRTRGRSAHLTGDLIVTSVEIAGPVVIDALNAVLTEHPDLRVQYRVNARHLKLEFGEAHIAVRAGPRPDDPDNVVQPLFTIASGLYAHASYAERYGLPATARDFSGHRFICASPDGSPPAFMHWLRARITEDQVGFVSDNARIRSQALHAGLGIGFCPMREAGRSPELVEVMAPLAAWDVHFWLVTHVDLHRTEKVQACLSHLKKAAAKHWPA